MFSFTPKHFLVTLQAKITLTKPKNHTHQCLRAPMCIHTHRYRNWTVLDNIGSFQTLRKLYWTSAFLLIMSIMEANWPHFVILGLNWQETALNYLKNNTSYLIRLLLTPLLSEPILFKRIEGHHTMGSKWWKSERIKKKV